MSSITDWERTALGFGNYGIRKPISFGSTSGFLLEKELKFHFHVSHIMGLRVEPSDCAAPRSSNGSMVDSERDDFDPAF